MQTIPDFVAAEEVVGAPAVTEGMAVEVLSCLDALAGLSGEGRAGVAPVLTGKVTPCCGCPADVHFPGEAHRIALERVAQLTKVARRIATMCPICLVNLRKAAGTEAEVLDISQVLAAAGGSS